MAKATLAIYGIKDRSNLQYPAYVHDHNICLMQDGKILQYLQLERFSKRKYDNRLDLFLEDLIEQGLLKLPQEFDIVSVNAFVGNAFISQGGKIRVESGIIDKLSEGLDAATAYYQYTDWEGCSLNAYNCSQELAHIGTNLAFFGNFKENSLLVHFDGAASLSNFSAFHYKDGRIHLLEYNWDLKYLANFFNDNALSFAIIGAHPGEHTSVPGKLMGFASWGKYQEEIADWLFAHDYFKEYWHREDEIIKSAQQTLGCTANSFDNRHPFWHDVAATLQGIFTSKLTKRLSTLQLHTGAKYLYYSGGCALNIVTNTAIIEQSIFEDVFIPPCCSDSGLSIGAACLLEWEKGNIIQSHSPYLNNLGIDTPQQFGSSSPLFLQEAIQKLLAGQVLGICNGPAEAGPRALGNRSLIARPDNQELSQRLSQQIKKREWYRPIAPVMLRSIAEMVSETPIHHLAKYMLLDYKIKPEYSDKLSGVIHTNGTARIQVLNEEEDNPFMYNLLKHLYEEHQVLGLINTSFNVQGQPIVHTPDDAISAAKAMELDGLILNYKMISEDELARH